METKITIKMGDEELTRSYGQGDRNWGAIVEEMLTVLREPYPEHWDDKNNKKSR